MRISDCCGAPPKDPIQIDLGLCSDCHDHCEYINQEDEENSTHDQRIF